MKIIIYKPNETPLIKTVSKIFKFIDKEIGTDFQCIPLNNEFILVCNKDNVGEPCLWLKNVNYNAMQEITSKIPLIEKIKQQPIINGSCIICRYNGQYTNFQGLYTDSVTEVHEIEKLVQKY